MNGPTMPADINGVRLCIHRCGEHLARVDRDIGGWLIELFSEIELGPDQRADR